MRAAIRLFLAVAVCCFSTGCITALTTIHLKPDGSGTIDQTMSMNAAAAAQFASMMKGMNPEGSEAAGESELFSEKDMREAASKFGEGVTFVSSTPIKTAERVGRVATYSFTDITKLHIEQKPAAPGPAGAVTTSGPAEDVLFKFGRQPGGTSLLTIVFPEAKVKKAAEEKISADSDDGEKSKEMDPAAMAMAKQMFDGLKIGIDLDVKGTIVKTNSAYVQGSRVTLLEMDFSELLKNDALLKHASEPKSIAEAKELLQGVKGFKMNLDPEVLVEFR